MAKSKTKAPAFMYYPKDLLVDTAMLTNEQVGAYWRLVSYAWIGLPGYKQCELPNDPESLARLVSLDLERWQAIASPVLQLFASNGEQKLIHNRLKKEAKAQMNWRKKSSEGGIKSGRSRRKAAKGGSLVVEPEGEPKPNSSIAPSSSSSEEEIKERENKDSLSSQPPVEKPKRKAPRTPESPIPDGFVLSAELVTWAATHTPGLSCQIEMAKFRDHAISHDRRCSDWPAAWRNWMRRAVEYSRGGGNGHGQQREVGEARPVAWKYSDVGIRSDASKT